MSAPASPLPPDPAPPGTGAYPSRYRSAETVQGPAADHRLGQPHDAIKRIAAAADRVLADTSSGEVPLSLLGAALAEPTGGRFDERDPIDRDLLLRVLTEFWDRLGMFGIQVRKFSGLTVHLDRMPTSGPRRLFGWDRIGTRAELARWARRAEPRQQEQRPAPPPCEPAPPPPVLPGAGRADWSIPARVKAAELGAGRPWPPAVRGLPGGDPEITAREER